MNPENIHKLLDISIKHAQFWHNKKCITEGIKTTGSDFEDFEEMENPSSIVLYVGSEVSDGLLEETASKYGVNIEALKTARAVSRCID